MDNSAEVGELADGWWFPGHDQKRYFIRHTAAWGWRVYEVKVTEEYIELWAGKGAAENMLDGKLERCEVLFRDRPQMRPLGMRTLVSTAYGRAADVGSCMGDCGDTDPNAEVLMILLRGGTTLLLCNTCATRAWRELGEGLRPIPPSVSSGRRES